MADQWYYGRDDQKHGPYSSRDLRELADSGKILPTDTIWKEGVERGVLAQKVKNLFPPSPATVPVADATSPAPPPGAPLPSEALTSAVPKEMPPPAPEAQQTPVEPESDKLPEDAKGEAESPFVKEAPAPPTPPLSQPKRPQQPAKKGRAVAGKGVIITSQDGTNVQFRKVCTVCGNEDNCRSTMPIRHGPIRIGFFCRKCKRQRQVEMQGILG
jgi:hypothetical protein